MARKIYFTPLKRSHLIAPFGVGSIVLSRNGVSVTICGLQQWLDARPERVDGRATWLLENQISDVRLTNRLGVGRLVAPPPLDDDPNFYNTWFVQVARFPLWEHCINPKCRVMVQRRPDEVAAGTCAVCVGQGRRNSRPWPTQQIPLLIACRAGHLSDIPWIEWVHTPALQSADLDDHDNDARAANLCAAPILTYKVSTDITAPLVECRTCEARIDLGQLRARTHPCPGERPWLAGRAAQACDEQGPVLERTATNLYYPQVVSAIHIPAGPTLDHRITAFLAGPTLAILIGDLEPGEHPDDDICSKIAQLAALHGITTTASTIADHIVATTAAAIDTDDTDVRRIELDVLLADEPSTSTGIGLPPLVVEARPLDRYTGPFFTGANRLISTVRAVPRLAETRVLTGFSRVDTLPEDFAAGFEMLWGAAPDPDQDRDWFPAYRVYGEGILLQLDSGTVARWQTANAANVAWQQGADVTAGWTSRHWLAHTLSHAVLREAASICGYSLPSLRERIYVDGDQITGRTAILIYTAEGDMHGTLGGLVELADPGRLEKLVAGAIEHAKWCGADPLCLNPIEGASLLTTPGACHHCLLVPETTCEFFNRGLDRATLVGGRPATTGFGRDLVAP